MKPFIKLFTLCFFICLATMNYGQSNEVGSGIAASFPGPIGNRIELGNVYNDLNFPLTIEAWVYPTSWLPSLYRPIMATENVGPGGVYYGLWFRFNDAGRLIFEIGDGTGGGWADRRGKVTTTSVALNAWTHVAVVANSITDISFYFNGVLQPVTNTDGGSGITTILNTTYPAYIGGQITPTTENDFGGMLDEVRLWNVSRSVTDIREKMCEKLTGTEAGLIGNWRFDENYIGSTVQDYSPTSTDATIVGTISKVTSGAPIGNVSTWIYPADFTGVSLSLSSPGGDKLKINKITNSPYGIHLYRVNEFPYFNTGLLSTPYYYYGVFPANSATAAKYTTTYTYAYSNGVVNAGNESEATLYKRLDNSVLEWNNSVSLLDTFTNRLVKKNFIGKSEFIFSIDTANTNGGTRFTNLNALQESSDIVAYPNPAINSLVIEGLLKGSDVYLINLRGELIYSFVAAEGLNELDMSVVASGIYFIVEQNTVATRYVKVVKQ